MIKTLSNPLVVCGFILLISSCSRSYNLNEISTTNQLILDTKSELNYLGNLTMKLPKEIPNKEKKYYLANGATAHNSPLVRYVKKGDLDLYIRYIMKKVKYLNVKDKAYIKDCMQGKISPNIHGFHVRKYACDSFAKCDRYIFIFESQNKTDLIINCSMHSSDYKGIVKNKRILFSNHISIKSIETEIYYPKLARIIFGSNFYTGKSIKKPLRKMRYEDVIKFKLGELGEFYLQHLKKQDDEIKIKK
ncbi:MAG: hypothetical protein COA79_22910 [Planctomycetota bacterium]|nr:MAG: hypothetical protein COA79_22910 [Planctomycetota bacterium]